MAADAYTTNINRDASWMARGNCVGLDPDLFFSASDKGQMADAKAVCMTCTVQADCLDWAVNVPERFGCWGGTSPRERTELRRKVRKGTFDPRAAVVEVRRKWRNRHGTHAGYMRHKRAGEPICAMCIQAEREYRRQQVAEFRRRSA